MKTILVTGAAGFVGSHLSEHFLQEGHRVIGLDNLITGSSKNIDLLSQFPLFSFIKHDIKDLFEYKEKIDMIFDFACPASPVDFVKLQVEIGEVCSLGTYNLLQLAVQHKARFLFASTSEVYGDPFESPQKETYNGNVNTTGIRSIYDEGKRFSEALIMAFHRRYNIETRIVRIFNTYGERMRANDGRVVPNFVTQALQNKPLTVQGDGTQTRSIQYITDLVEGVIKLSESSIIQPINIGNPEEMTVLELAKKIIHLTGSSSEIIYTPLPEHDPKRRCPDITKAKALLDWEPKISPDEGLKKTIEWFRQTMEQRT